MMKSYSFPKKFFYLKGNSVVMNRSYEKRILNKALTSPRNNAFFLCAKKQQLDVLQKKAFQIASLEKPIVNDLFGKMEIAICGKKSEMEPNIYNFNLIYCKSGSTFNRIKNHNIPKVRNVDHQIMFTNGFWLADIPVTQGLWEYVMGGNPSRHNGFFVHKYQKFQPNQNPDRMCVLDYGIDLQRPIESITWLDCIIFCNRLSILSGLKPYYKIINAKNNNVFSEESMLTIAPDVDGFYQCNSNSRRMLYLEKIESSKIDELKKSNSNSLLPYSTSVKHIFENIIFENGNIVDKMQKPYKHADIFGVETPIKILFDNTSNGYRLPTIAEWEYAAYDHNQIKSIGELDSISWNIFNSSRDVDMYYDGSRDASIFLKRLAKNDSITILDLKKNILAKENKQTMNIAQTHSVKTKEPNALGFYDMLGNVRQFCIDYIDSSENSTTTSYKITKGTAINPILENNYDFSSFSSYFDYDCFTRGGLYCANDYVLNEKFRKVYIVHTYDSIGLRVAKNCPI